MTHVQLYKPNQIWHVYKNDAFTNISANQYDSITHVSNYLSQTKYDTCRNIKPNQILHGKQYENPKNIYLSFRPNQIWNVSVCKIVRIIVNQIIKNRESEPNKLWNVYASQTKYVTFFKPNQIFHINAYRIKYVTLCNQTK